MHRDDSSKFLLYIEPKKEEKLNQPIEDELTEFIEFAFSKSVSGIANYSKIDSEPAHKQSSGWRGWHTTDCGERSNNKDFLLENGLITNSLASFYVSNYRNSIQKNDWVKIQSLINFYQKDIDISKFLN